MVCVLYVYVYVGVQGWGFWALFVEQSRHLSNLFLEPPLRISSNFNPSMDK